MAGQQPKRLLLVWDAPNLDMGLSNVLGAKPNPADRPNFNALAKWLVARAESLGTSAEGTVFANVSPASAEKIRSWVDAVRIIGFSVFALPKVGDSDVDGVMQETLRQAIASGSVVEVLIGSNDRRAFDEIVTFAEQHGVTATYLGFREFVPHASAIPFIDLGEIPGLLSSTLQRFSLANLPAQGVLLPPLGKLGEGYDPKR